MSAALLIRDVVDDNGSFTEVNTPMRIASKANATSVKVKYRQKTLRNRSTSQASSKVVMGLFGELRHVSGAVDGRALQVIAIEDALSRWAKEGAWMSSLHELMRSPHAEPILAGGNLAVQIILKRMKAGDARIEWLSALKRLTDENPVPEEFRGCVPQMREAWLQWAQTKGYLSL